MKTILVILTLYLAAICASAQSKWASAYQTALDCHIAAVCLDDFDEIRRATCRLYVDGQELGTGTLINNTALDRKPYVLTSAHVLERLFTDGTPPKELTTNQITFLWGFEEPTCNSPIANSEIEKIQGATLVACDTAADMALLLMPKAPSIACRPYWAGWNLSEAPHGPFTCFHHPKGDAKKVAFTNDITPNTSAIYSNKYNEEYFWKTQGLLLEGGSSGAALIDNDGKIIGALTGGDTPENCNDTDDLTKYFWMLRKAWNDQIDNTFQTLAQLLDPLETGATSLDGIDGITADGLECRQFKTYSIDSDIHQSIKQLDSINTLARQPIDITAADSIEVWGLRFASYDAKCNNAAQITLGIADGEDKEPIFAEWQRAVYLTKAWDTARVEYFRYESVLEYNFSEPIKISTSDIYAYIKINGFTNDDYILPAVVETEENTEAQWFADDDWAYLDGRSLMIDVLYSALPTTEDAGSVTAIISRTDDKNVSFRCAADGIIICSDALEIVNIYDVSGRQISSCDAGSADIYSLDANGLSSGIYIVSATTSDGNTASIKISVKH